MTHGEAPIRRRAPWIVVVLLSASTVLPARENAPELRISPDLRDLLRAEMQGVAGGLQALVTAISAGDWNAVRNTADAIRASYIMERSLTPEQRRQLERLPPEFKRLDAEFHQRAQRLGEAASDHDAERVNFYFYRMMESCTACHSRFAASRFPGFSAEPAAHRH